MADNSSLYGSTPPTGTVSSSNYTTLYNGNGNYVPGGDNVIISGTLTVNGCAILTDCSTFSLLPYNATTVNAFGSATAVSIGGATGVTTIQNQLSTGNYLFPLADGTADQILATDGAGVLYWTTANNTLYNIDASSTTGGANFNLTGSDGSLDTIKFANGTGISVSRTNANTITITNTAPEDAYTIDATATTGGANLNLSNSAATDSVALKGTGATTVTRTSADVITISSTDANTTYTQNASATTGGANLNLVGSDSTTDTVKFASGTNITVAQTDANTITISSNADDIPDGTAKGQVLYWNGSAWTANTELEFDASTNRLSLINNVSGGASAVELLKKYSGTLADGTNVGQLFGAYDGTTFTYTHRFLSEYDTGGNPTFRIQADPVGNFTPPTTTIYSQLRLNNNTLEIDGNQFIANANLTGAPTEDGIFRVNRGTSTDATLTWNETDDRWDLTDSLSVDNGVLYVNATNNRVGINNTNPQYELHIDQGLDGLTQIGMTTTERTTILTMNDGDDLLSLNYNGANRLQFDLNNQWFNQGNLGVNNATPAYTLDVGGDIKVGGDTIYNSYDEKLIDYSQFPSIYGTSRQANFQATNNIGVRASFFFIDGQTEYNTNTLITSATTANQVLSYFDQTEIEAVKSTIVVKSGTAVQCIEVLMVQDGTTISLNTYGDVRTAGNLTTVSSGYNATTGYWELRVTPVNAVTTYRVTNQIMY